VTIQPQTAIIIGVLLLALVTVESGGYFLTRVVRGHVEANLLQRNFFRAGHAHAAVLLVLGIAVLIATDLAGFTDGWLAWVARTLVPIAAILMPAGFFLSVLGKDPQRPSRLIILLWLGVTSLTIGLLVAGVGMIVAGASAV
jgi:hypothetical protein